jgi:hypothetical protein
MEFTFKKETKEDVAFVAANIGARYWEDSSFNGVDDTEDGRLVPLRNGDYWSIVVNLETGQIQDWPKGTIADIHYKSCDDNTFYLLNSKGLSVAKYEGYVIDMFCPKENGFGDYVIMDIDENGFIQNWKVDLKPFKNQ